MFARPYVDRYTGSMILTKASAKILCAFLDAPGREHYGFGLMRSTGVKSGSLYPILDRLRQAGWVEVEDEDIDEHAEGRPRRKLYRLTAVGESAARHAVAGFFRDLGTAPSWIPNLEGA